MKAIIIKSQVAPMFWAGDRWNEEYPNAEIYTSSREARAILKALEPMAEAVEHYGEDNQRIVAKNY